MIVCSFSGGETSGYMAIRLKQECPDTKFVFANTGQENEETLEFVKAVDGAYDLGVVWIEAVVNPEKGKGTTYKVVDFDTASRNGEPFEAVISKYGVPNVSFLHCSRELKLSPFNKWQKDHYPDAERAIGIRSDEIDRVSPDYKKLNYSYPLAFKWPTTKNEINVFWDSQPFRLNLKHYQGNCKWCYKKSFNKLAWICKENPEHFDFPERMEKEYGHIGRRLNAEKYLHQARVLTNARFPHSLTCSETQIRVIASDLARERGDWVKNTIFRGNRTALDIREMAKDAVEPVDDARIYEVNTDLFGHDDMSIEFDVCGSESCEAM